MIILIDNYDSFTYNLMQYVGMFDPDIEIIRNDLYSAEDIIARKPDGFIISPGPCSPDKAGICIELVQKAALSEIPLLGICLGHQCIGQAFGGNIIKGPHPIHGKTSSITHNGQEIYEGVPSPFTVTRYHSLIIEQDTSPECLEITSTTEDGLIIMSVQHRTLPIFGVQYHPESIATDSGLTLIKNFVEMTGS